MSARKSSHGTIFLIVSSGSPLALIASSLRSTSKKPVCPMTRSLHPPMAHCGQRVRFVATWREEFFKVPTRLRLPIAKKTVFVRIGPGVALGYRRNQTAGSWVLRVADGTGGHWTKRVGDADDLQAADGGAVLDFWQAQERARALARASGKDDGDSGKLATVAEAVDRYEAELQARGGDRANAARVRLHLSDTLVGKTVALLTARDFRSWRDALVREQLSPAAINRV